MQYLDNSDNVFVSAESAGTSMTVAGLAEVHGAVNRQCLERDLQRLAEGAARFRQRLVVGDGPFARPYWVPVGAAFDVRNHLSIRPMPSSLGDLHDAIGQLMETPLSYEIPLWHVTCFEGAPASYLLIRLSHILSDGQGFARTFALLLGGDQTADTHLVDKVHKAGRQCHDRGSAMSWVWRLIAFLYMVVIMLYNAVNVLFHSRRSLRAPKTAVRHQVGFSSGVKVSEVKELRRLIGTSFNDILVSCAASAIERHLLECDQLKDARTLFMIPTSLRADADFTLSNQSSAFTLSVPIGVDPIDRLRTVSRRMHRQKATWEPEILYVLGRFVCRWPAMFATTARLAQLFNEVIVTNVPGPASSDALLIGGLRIVAMTPIVCLAHQNTIGIGFLSFGDEIRFSVHMKLDEGGDGQAVYRRHSAQNIADALAKAFRELRDRIRSSDGSRQAT